MRKLRLDISLTYLKTEREHCLFTPQGRILEIDDIPAYITDDNLYKLFDSVESWITHWLFVDAGYTHIILEEGDHV